MLSSDWRKDGDKDRVAWYEQIGAYIHGNLTNMEKSIFPLRNSMKSMFAIVKCLRSL
jgi:hypothetical protein